LGPNGAGKRTLLRAISGIVPVTGEIRYQGDRIDKLAPHEIIHRGIVHYLEIGYHCFGFGTGCQPYTGTDPTRIYLGTWEIGLVGLSEDLMDNDEVKRVYFQLG
jgi:branched-chain amino acid transport system ATP-binding protein